MNFADVDFYEQLQFVLTFRCKYLSLSDGDISAAEDERIWSNHVNWKSDMTIFIAGSEAPHENNNAHAEADMGHDIRRARTTKKISLLRHAAPAGLIPASSSRNFSAAEQFKAYPSVHTFHTRGDIIIIQ